MASPSRSGLLYSHYDKTHRGGAEEFIHQLARRLVSLGSEITLLTTACANHRTSEGRCPSASELDKFDRTCGYRVERLETLLASGAWRGQGLGALSKRNMYGMMLATARRARADYIIVNNDVGVLGNICAYLVARRLRIPLVNVFHRAERIVAGQARYVDWACRQSIRRSDAVVCVTHDIANTLRTLGGFQHVRPYVFHNGIDLEAIESWRSDEDMRSSSMESVNVKADRSAGIHERSPILASVARLVEGKGIQWVIRAMPDVLREFPNALYLIGGDGPYRAELESLADQVLPGTDQRRSVAFLGWVSESERNACYDIADLYVMPSVYDTYGIVFNEAGAFGTPSIACDVSGVPEAVRHGDTGCLVSPEELDTVHDSILRLLNDESERSRMGVNAQTFVQQERSWERNAAQYHQLLEELCGK